ncbi:MAG: hypothetical protein VB071_10925 [Lawsonibacter sp.]|nr:hypothetical protein [Lawsonibacter sp.]
MQKLQCEICGGSLIMAEDGEGAVCESCGMRFKKETVKKMVMELSGPIKIDGPVQIEGMENASTLSARAADFEKLGMEESAQNVYREMTQKYPGDYRGGLGLARAAQTAQQLALLEKALKLAPPEVQAELKSTQAQAQDRLQEEHRGTATEMAECAYVQYHAQVEARQKAQDERTLRIAQAQAQLAGAKQIVRMETNGVRTARILLLCFAAFAVLCYFAAWYLGVVMGAAAAILAFLFSFGSSGRVSDAQAALNALTSHPAEDLSAQIAAIPVPDGSDSPNPAVFRTRFDRLLQLEIEPRERQLAELQQQSEHLMKLETLGREIAAFCNKQGLQRVCDTLQISHLYFGSSGNDKAYDFAACKSFDTVSFYDFAMIYGHTVRFYTNHRKRKYKNGKDKTYWERSENAWPATCEVWVDEHNYRSLFEPGK